MPGRDYRDPLYGFVSTTDLEQQLIDTGYFQRLRRIRQLGCTDLVYPSACHTRFEHALGVLEVGTRLFDRLVDRGLADMAGWSREETEHARAVFRLACLLHDLGHPPFSHTSEELLPEGLSHEDMTYRIILETELASLIDRHLGQGTARRVAGIAAGRPQTRSDSILSELLAGDLGADRLDYLNRDAYHLGVSYGRYDLFRLLHTVRPHYSDEVEGPELVVEYGGLHATEGFILARYFMFLDVYFHRTRRILEWHLTEALRNLLEEGRFPREVSAYVRWTDDWVLARSASLDPELRDRVWGRRHFRLAFEAGEHPDPADLVLFDWMETEVAKRFPGLVVTDRAEKALYHMDAPQIYVDGPRGIRPISEYSPVIKSLPAIKTRRIYAHPGVREEVRNFCQSFWKNRGRYFP